MIDSIIDTSHLRTFQAEDLPFFLEVPRSMILYEPRLGKTVEVCHILAADNQTRMCLIFCPKNALFVWSQHLLEWIPKLAPERKLHVMIVRGSPQGRIEQWKDLGRLNKILPTGSLIVAVCTAGVVDRDANFLNLTKTIKQDGVLFDTIIGDEVHLRMRKRGNKLVKVVKELAHSNRCRRFHPLSGTMAGAKGPLDFWALLNIIDARKFTSYWRYADHFAEFVATPYGQEYLGPRNLAEFHRLLDQYARRRFRKDVATQMPVVQRGLLQVEATAEQKELIYEIDQQGFVWTPGDRGLILATNGLTQTLRKRQILTCPKILHPNYGVGAAFADLVERLQDPEMSPTVDDQHVVIFSAFKEALPHFEEYLRAHGFEHVWQIYGGLEPEDLADRIEQFVKNKGIMLCSTKYAQAFSLASSKLCYHIGPEWDPNDNKQAEDRLVGQSGYGVVDSLYYGHKDLDFELVEAINIKNRYITLTMGNTRKSQ